MQLQNVRCALVEVLKGLPLAVKVSQSGVEFSLPDNELGSFKDILESRAQDMFNDMREMIMENHRVCDLLEAKGEPYNRPSINRDFQTITISGTVVGGSYPHEDVPVVEDATPTHEGTPYYSQMRSFFADSLFIDDEQQDLYQLGSLCMSFGIPVVPIATFGTYEECLESQKNHEGNCTLVPMMTPMVDSLGEAIIKEDNLVRMPEFDNNPAEGWKVIPVDSKEITE